MDASAWNNRYAAAQQWSDKPNALAAELLAELPPGTAIDVAAGEDRMALWLAAAGWQVTALDFSAAGLRRGQDRAEQLDLSVQWQVADATTADLGAERYDLVLVLYCTCHEPCCLRCCAGAQTPSLRVGGSWSSATTATSSSTAWAAHPTPTCCTTSSCSPRPRPVSTSSGWNR